MSNQTETTPMSLLERIQAVALSVMNIEKDMMVGTGNSSYKAVGDTQVTLAVKKAEAQNGIISIPIKQELIKSETLLSPVDQYGKQKTTHVDIVKMTVRVYLISDKDQYIDVETFGRGVDSADKGFGKASTYARKYALLNLYKIATGVDPDANRSVATEVSSTIEETKLKVINYLLSNDDYRNNVFRHYGRGDIDELSATELKQLFINLQKKGVL